MTKNKDNVIAFALVAYAYVCLNLFFRWINTSFGRISWGGQPPDLVQIVISVLLNLSSVGIVFLIPFLLFRFKRTLPYAFLLYALLLFCEGDSLWYSMSRKHINSHELERFVRESWSEHFGFKQSDYIGFIKISLAHLFCVASIFWISRVDALKRIKINVKVVLFISLYGFFSQKILILKHGGEGFVNSIAIANPLYMNFLDDEAIEYKAGMKKPLLSSMKFNPSRAAGDEDSSAVAGKMVNGKNILIITIEGWNYSLLNSQTMLFLDGYRKNCIESERHYSTGNSTTLGLYGLLSGQYATRNPNGKVGIISALDEGGYYLSALGGNVLLDDKTKMQQMLKKFNGGYHEFGKDDWAKIGKIKELSSRNRSFIFSHYWGTHFSYDHHDKYVKFLPEVGEKELADLRQAHLLKEKITNRYKNSLVELDDWLRSVLLDLDLNNDIILITGDHGEEMFESGKFGHNSSLEDPQTRVPLFICLNNARNYTFRHSVTSHADIGNFLYQLVTEDIKSSDKAGLKLTGNGNDFAITASADYGSKPNSWRVIFADGSEVRVKRKSPNRLIVTDYTKNPAANDQEFIKRVNDMMGNFEL